MTGDRPWHWLRSVSGCSSPSVCVFVDTESLETPSRFLPGAKDLTFRLGCATACWLAGGRVTDRKTLDFSATDTFWQWLQQVAPRRGLAWIFAHNLGFDFTMLGGWRQLDADPESLVYCVLEDPPAIICTRQARRCTQWVDTLNYWRCSLSALAPSVGMVKLPMPAATAPNCEWYDYCRRDVDIIERLTCSLISFTTVTLSSSFRPTAASLAWSAYRKSSTFRPLLIHGNYRALSLERSALFGGRASCYTLGRVSEPVTELDTNSLYPAMMVREQLPTQLVSLTRNPAWNDLRAYVREYYCLATVALADGHPPLPARTSHGVRYSSGAGEFTVCGADLRECLETGLVRGVGSCAMYLGGHIAGDFCRDLYNRKMRARQTGNLADELATKLILNSLAGKFAQLGSKWVHDAEATAPDKWGYWWSRDVATGQLRRARAIAGMVEAECRGVEPHNSFPIVFAAICAAGRRELEKFRQLADPSEVCYTDTDSLHVRSGGRTGLCRAGVVDPGRLGSLRIVRAGTDAYYWGPKSYRIGDHTVHGCLAGNAREIADGVWLQDTFSGIQQTLVTGRLDRVQVIPRTIRLSDRSQEATHHYGEDQHEQGPSDPED